MPLCRYRHARTRTVFFDILSFEATSATAEEVCHTSMNRPGVIVGSINHLLRRNLTLMLPLPTGCAYVARLFPRVASQLQGGFLAEDITHCPCFVRQLSAACHDICGNGGARPDAGSRDGGS